MTTGIGSAFKERSEGNKEQGTRTKKIGANMSTNPGNDDWRAAAAQAGLDENATVEMEELAPVSGGSEYEEKGVLQYDDQGRMVLGEDGRPLLRPGLLDEDKSGKLPATKEDTANLADTAAGRATIRKRIMERHKSGGSKELEEKRPSVPPATSVALTGEAEQVEPWTPTVGELPDEGLYGDPGTWSIRDILTMSTRLSEVMQARELQLTPEERSMFDTLQKDFPVETVPKTKASVSFFEEPVSVVAQSGPIAVYTGTESRP